MNKDNLIKYWISSSEKDHRAMKNLFLSKDYCWALFIGHLVIEKLLKACYVKKIDISPPFYHNLLRLAQECKLVLSPEYSDWLILITTFNINARYPDYKQEFYKKCSVEYTREKITLIERLRKWLLQEIKRK